MSKNFPELSLLYLRGIREWTKVAYWTLFSPRKLEALNYDRQLARDVEQRWNGHKINVFNLVYERDTHKRAKLKGNPPPAGDDDDFVVFLGPSLEVDFITVKDPSPDGAKLIAQAEAAAAVDCESLSPGKLLAYRLQMAQVIVCALRDQEPVGKKLLTEASSYLNKRILERSREWTLVSLLICGLVVFLASLLSAGSIAVLVTSSKLLAPLQGGFLGSFVSMAVTTGKSKCDAAAGFKLHFLEVLMRLAIGVIFGGIAIGLAGSSFGPEPMKTLVATVEGCLVLSFGAGLFEQAVPSILSKYSRGTTGKIPEP